MIPYVFSFMVIYLEVSFACLVMQLYNCTQRRDWLFCTQEYVIGGIKISLMWPTNMGWVIRDFLALIRR